VRRSESNEDSTALARPGAINRAAQKPAQQASHFPEHKNRSRFAMSQSYTPLEPVNMNASSAGAECEDQGVRAKRLVARRKVCAQRRTTARRDAAMSFFGGWIATQLGALLGAFFLGLIAVSAADYNALVPAVAINLIPLEVAFGYLAVIYAGGVTFGQFYAGHFAPHVTLVAWLSDPKAFSLLGIARYVGILVFELIGYVLAAFLSSFFVGGAAAPLGCANPAASVGLAQQILGSLIVKLFVGHIFLLSVKRHKGGPFGVLAIALVVAASILSLGPVTGGAYSLSRYLGVGFVQGGACLTARTALVELGTFIVAGVLNFLLASFVFTRSASTMAVEYKKCKTDESKRKDC